MTQDLSVMSNKTLGSAIEDERFEFKSFNTTMKNYCLNHKDPAVKYPMKTGMYYVSAEILFSAVEDESFNFDRFNIEMTLLCLTSPIDDALPPAVKTDD